MKEKDLLYSFMPNFPGLFSHSLINPLWIAFFFSFWIFGIFSFGFFSHSVFSLEAISATVITSAILNDLKTITSPNGFL